MNDREVEAYIETINNESNEVRNEFVKTQGDKLIHAAKLIANALEAGNKILIFGNGGSAADAQHMAAELVGRMLIKDRKPLPAIALTTDSSNLTAISNDFGYDMVFSRQVLALGKEGDVAIAISTSGNSENVLLAAEACEAIGIPVIGLTGGQGGRLPKICKISLNVALGANSCRIQEAHIFIIHALVDLVERFYL